ncbi:hypothetical protein Hanom_Chr12g01140011 [Helianthus anomalus]
MSKLPWIRIAFNYFLPIFPPSISIIKNINITRGLNHDSWFSNRSTPRPRNSFALGLTLPIQQTNLKVRLKSTYQRLAGQTDQT